VALRTLLVRGAASPVALLVAALSGAVSPGGIRHSHLGCCGANH